MINWPKIQGNKKCVSIGQEISYQSLNPRNVFTLDCLKVGHCPHSDNLSMHSTAPIRCTIDSAAMLEVVSEISFHPKIPL